MNENLLTVANLEDERIRVALEGRRVSWERSVVPLLRRTAPTLAVLGGVGALEWVRERFQRRQMFAPSTFPRGVWEPQRHGVSAEDHWFVSGDGVRLHGWWIDHPKARGTVLYCHGNSGSLGSQVPALRQFRRLRCSVFAFDYRGYGRSEGEPHESGLYRDVRAAYRYLVDELGKDPKEILILGHSLGGAVAIDAATELEIAGLIVQSSFTQMRDMARREYPGWPVHWIAKNQFRSVNKVGRIGKPVLFVHGRLDERIPLAQGRELFEAARQPKEWLEIPSGGHNDLPRQGRLRYWLRLSKFRDRCLRGQF